MKRAFLDAVILTITCSALGLAVNAWIHPKPLPFIAQKPYETMVPCPVPGGEATPISPADDKLYSKDSFILDARDRKSFERWHAQGAMCVPFDYLDPTPPETLRAVAKKAASSHAKRVIVYGDGQDPDTGEQLAKEISGKGIKNVFFVKGGAPAMEPEVKGAGQ